jgi:hypothetical protein
MAKFHAHSLAIYNTKLSQSSVIFTVSQYFNPISDPTSFGFEYLLYYNNSNYKG